MPKIEKLGEPDLYRLTFPPSDEWPEESSWNARLYACADPTLLMVYSESDYFVGTMPKPKRKPKRLRK